MYRVNLVGTSFSVPCFVSKSNVPTVPFYVHIIPTTDQHKRQCVLDLHGSFSSEATRGLNRTCSIFLTPFFPTLETGYPLRSTGCASQKRSSNWLSLLCYILYVPSHLCVTDGRASVRDLQLNGITTYPSRFMSNWASKFWWGFKNWDLWLRWCYTVACVEPYCLSEVDKTWTNFCIHNGIITVIYCLQCISQLFR